MRRLSGLHDHSSSNMLSPQKSQLVVPALVAAPSDGTASGVRQSDRLGTEIMSAATCLVARLGPVVLDGQQLALSDVSSNESRLLVDYVLLHVVAPSVEHVSSVAQDSARKTPTPRQQYLCPHSSVESRSVNPEPGCTNRIWRHQCSDCKLLLRTVWSRCDHHGGGSGDGGGSSDGAPAVCEVFTTGVTTWLLGPSRPRCSEAVRLSRAAPVALPSQMVRERLCDPTATATATAPHSGKIQLSCWPSPSATTPSSLTSFVTPVSSGGTVSEQFLGVVSSEDFSRQDVAAFLKDVYAPAGLQQRHDFKSALHECERAGLSAGAVRSILCTGVNAPVVAAPMVTVRDAGASDCASDTALDGPWSLVNDVRCVLGVLRAVESDFGVSYAVQRTHVDERVLRAAGGLDAGGGTYSGSGDGGGGGPARGVADGDITLQKTPVHAGTRTDASTRTLTRRRVRIPGE
jgi:hypothetical protein